MSATGRSDRGGDGTDYFPTPDWAVRRFLEACPLPGGRWLEPCAGDGQIIRVANLFEGIGRHGWTAVELRTEPAQILNRIVGATHAHTGIGFVEWAAGYLGAEQPLFDVAITNPPFKCALEIIEASMQVSRFTVMLLRLNFLGSDDRAAFMRTCVPDVYVLPDRPPFAMAEVWRKDEHGRKVELIGHRPGTDATEYAWMVWDTQRMSARGSVQVLGSTPEAEKKAWLAELRLRHSLHCTLPACRVEEEEREPHDIPSPPTASLRDETPTQAGGTVKQRARAVK